jgi:hypothetical protein
MLDLGDADKPRLNKIVHEFVHVAPMSADEISAAEAKGEAVRPIRHGAARGEIGARPDLAAAALPSPADRPRATLTGFTRSSMTPIG